MIGREGPWDRTMRLREATTGPKHKRESLSRERQHYPRTGAWHEDGMVHPPIGCPTPTRTPQPQRARANFQAGGQRQTQSQDAAATYPKFAHVEPTNGIRPQTGRRRSSTAQAPETRGCQAAIGNTLRLKKTQRVFECQRGTACSIGVCAHAARGTLGPTHGRPQRRTPPTAQATPSPHRAHSMP